MAQVSGSVVEIKNEYFSRPRTRYIGDGPRRFINFHVLAERLWRGLVLVVTETGSAVTHDGYLSNA